MTDRTPSLADVIRQAVEHRLSTLHVCLPGVIESYNAVKQTCSVRPAIMGVLRDPTGAESSFTYPIIPDVPVAHPRAGSWFVHLPLARGDSVVLVFAERALDQWRARGGVQDPLDVRMHNVTDAIAIPGNLYPDANALMVAANHLSIGHATGSTIHVKQDGTVALGSETPADAAARASVVAANLDALKAAFNAWVPVPNDGGAALKLILTALFASWPADVASVKVKIDP